MLVLIVALVQSLILAAFLFYRAYHANDALVKTFENLRDELDQKRSLCARLDALRSNLSDEDQFRRVAAEFLNVRETLKAEHGRATIVTAELNALERRLRELEEVGRELEASQTETKEELKILLRKEDDLRSKNESLRTRIADSLAKMDNLIAEIELTAKMQDQVSQMKSELLRSEERIQTILNQIQETNQQYFNLKRRYDALDVEYAQLYQQLTERAGRG
jgi:chromosome segregation ATPase